jgi:hypothetical protein
MKRCPTCEFLNEERQPTCSVCHTVLVDVLTTPAEDPLHEEHEQRALQLARHRRERWHLIKASLLYAGAITLLAWVPGGITDERKLLVFTGAALLTALAVVKGWAGTFWSGLLQGGSSVGLFLYFEAIHLFIFGAIALHLMLAPLFCHWVEQIRSSHW